MKNIFYGRRIRMKAIVAKTIRARQLSKRITRSKGMKEWLEETLGDKDYTVLGAIKKYYPDRLDDYLEGRLLIKVVEINDSNRDAINLRKQMASTDGNLVVGYDYGELYI
jgi:uncharacterized protein YeeX (DUF496 family)